MKSLPFIYHGQSADWLTREDNKLTVTLATEKAVNFTKVLLRHEPDNEEYLVEMTLSKTTEHLTYWQASFPLNSDRDVTHYTFKLLTECGQYWLDAKGVSKRISPRETHFKYNALHQPPSWVQEQVFYQIFPDRFCNGNPEISVKEGEYFVSGGTKPVVTKQWGEPVDTKGGNAGCEFYGGDLYGVESKLDYLQNLGVTALYLNPIFTAPSNHKYDTSNYVQVDPHLGSNEHFASLCQQLRDREMKIMLDAVFNHTSTEHPWFNLQGLQDSLGAYQSPDSPYRDYYFFNGDRQDYVGWKGIQSLPVLNFENQQVKDYIYASDEAVIKHWLKPPYQIDAWRFDVIHMLGEGEGATNNAHYVKAFRDSAKQVNPDCYVLGEHFFEATQWLQGDQEDGAMNYYGFAHPVRALLAKLDIAFDPIDINVGDFVDWQAEARAKLPWQNQLAQLNQLDSHDTARFLELVKHDPRLFQLASVLLFSYVGTPCIYYGTELGMMGSHDPDNRRTMPWEQTDNSEYLDWFRQLIALRKANPALQKGDYIPVHHDDDCFVFARKVDGNTMLCAFNLSEKTVHRKLPVWRADIHNGTFNGQLCGEVSYASNGLLNLSMPPRSALLLLKEES
ncbi:maltodextrin glucosidase [Vibrio europaeus]|uniref:maltodextrin glucosidase n=1 Tax=Vibrio europaeus TaxID=300876 RepID=UPI00233F3243|nr:maltodextrin glucosidase [Vibrio europaeus]MDC5842066.1 maltodextrin glucosidase [Vibrio europaeus]MDC5855420.1 maltodextrin glucosidase [Vibrio europaeus]